MPETDTLRVYRVSIEVSDAVCIMDDIEDVLDHLDLEAREVQGSYDREAARQKVEAAVLGERLEFGVQSSDGDIPDLTYVDVAEMRRADYDALLEFDGW
jgi:hypothetical protein